MQEEIKKVRIPQFVPRSYQLPFLRSMDDGCKRAVIVWHRRCLEENTHVLLEDGSWKYIKDLKKGERILSWDGEKIVPDVVKDVWCVGKKTTCKVFSTSYPKLECTLDHKFAVSSAESYSKYNERINWVEAQNLNYLDMGFVYSGTDFFSSFDSRLIEKLVSNTFQKRLPRKMWELDEKSIGKFICKFFSKNGEINFLEDRKNFNISLMISCGKNEEFAWDIYWLLRKVKILLNAPKKDKKSNIWKIKVWQPEFIKKILSYGIIEKKEDEQKKALKLLKDFKKRKFFKSLYQGHIKIEKEFILSNCYDIETENNNNFFANGYLVHNSGKEIVCFNWMIKQAWWHRVGTYVYFFPTTTLGRRILWDGSNKDGKRFLDYIPSEIIDGKPNSVEMKIRLTNGSLIQIIGTDQIINVGINPIGCIFSEYSLQDPKSWEFVRPILRENGGWSIFNFTPRGRNSAYDLFVMARNNPDWFCQLLSVEDTGVISKEDLQKERDEGMSEELIQQEYFCNFSQGIEGSYYGKYIDKLRRDGRIINIPYDPSLDVSTFWDLGYGDSTSIIFVQFIGKEIRIIDSYENSGEGLSHYAKVLQDKDYKYGTHYAPHDVESGHLSIGKSLKHYAYEIGIKFETIPKTEIEFGIECTRSIFPYLWIDEKNNTYLLKCIENYHKKFNSKDSCYSNTPHHDWSSHFADAFRYLGVANKLLIGNIKRSLTPDKIKEMRQRNVNYF